MSALAWRTPCWARLRPARPRRANASRGACGEFPVAEYEVDIGPRTQSLRARCLPQCWRGARCCSEELGRTQMSTPRLGNGVEPSDPLPPQCRSGEHERRPRHPALEAQKAPWALTDFAGDGKAQHLALSHPVEPGTRPPPQLNAGPTGRPSSTPLPARPALAVLITSPTAHSLAERSTRPSHRANIVQRRGSRPLRRTSRLHCGLRPCQSRPPGCLCRPCHTCRPCGVEHPCRPMPRTTK